MAPWFSPRSASTARLHKVCGEVEHDIERCPLLVDTVNGRVVNEVSMEVKQGRHKLNLAFDFNPKTDSPLTIAKELQEPCMADPLGVDSQTCLLACFLACLPVCLSACLP